MKYSAVFNADVKISCREPCLWIVLIIIAAFGFTYMFDSFSPQAHPFDTGTGFLLTYACDGSSSVSFFVEKTFFSSFFFPSSKFPYF